KFGWTEVGDFSAAAAEIRAAASTIACEIANADGAEDCAERMQTASQTAVTSAAGDLILGLFPWEAWANIIYTGIAELQDGTEADLADLLTPGAYSCCECEVITTYNGKGTVVAFTATTAEVDSEIVTANRDKVQFNLHRDNVAEEFCQDEVTISSVSVVGGGNFSRLLLKDNDFNTTFDTGVDLPCGEALSQLVGKPAGYVFIERYHAYCGSGGFTINIEWENA
ncbi:unnamed protein product, partial [marine sediment metagenome]